MDEKEQDDAVIKAAKRVDAHEMILHLPSGYDSQTGTFQLSGGQRQRIGLARAFYGDPCLIVLDEPNANLDKAGNIALLDTIKKAREQKTTLIIISHHSDVIQFADTVVLINQGRVQMQGPRDEVIKKAQQIKQQASHLS